VTADPQRLLLIGQRDNVARGVVRFDIQGQEAEVSIYVVPGVQDPGLGRDLLLTAERWLAVHRPQISKVHAHVLGNNARSQFLFSGSEYQVESTSYSKRLQ
jgi:UDP-2,4-diacetamido-2,4,6-trideoxy-beta-L-altropyranose hydrolase